MQEFRNYMNEKLEKHRIPGAGVIVRRGDEIVLHEGFGYADREEGRKVTPETVFGIGSVTKSFTAMAIMQLVDAGKIDVQKPIAEYIPAFVKSGKTDLTTIRVHHFLTNSSGMPPMSFLRNAMADSVMKDPSRELMEMKDEDYSDPIRTTDELIRRMVDSEIELIRPPGQIFSYFNEGFSILGRIIEVVSGQDYDSYIQENIFDPLGMTRSTLSVATLGQMDDVTNLYSYIGGFERVEATPGWWEAPAMTAAGFIRSTTADMARYARAYFGKSDIISPQSLEQMTAPHIQTSPGRWYGYGLMIQPDYHGRKMVEHGGNIKGVAAYLTMFPGEELVSVMLHNITGGPCGDMALAPLNAVFGLPLETQREEFPEVELPGPQKQKLLGQYGSDEGAEINVYLDDDGRLQLRMGKNRFPARAVSSNSLLVNLNGSDALMQFLDEEESRFGAIFFGFRVMDRRGEAQANAE